MPRDDYEAHLNELGYSNAYRKFIENDDDYTGKIAYSIYKKLKIDFIENQQDKKRESIFPQIKNIVTKDYVDAIREVADKQLNTYSANLVKKAEAEAKAWLAGKSFFFGCAASLAASFIFAGIGDDWAPSSKHGLVVEERLPEKNVARGQFLPDTDIFGIEPAIGPGDDADGTAKAAAFLETVKEPMIKCSAIALEPKRLACLENLLDSLPTERAPSINQAESETWHVDIDRTSPGGGERVLVFAEADAISPYWMENVTFHARCQANRTEVYIDWGGKIGDDVFADGRYWKDISLHLGKATTIDDRWLLANDRQTILAPSWPGHLLRELINAERLSIRTDINNRTIAVEFNLIGLEKALQPLTRACDWTL